MRLPFSRKSRGALFAGLGMIGAALMWNFVVRGVYISISKTTLQLGMPPRFPKEDKRFETSTDIEFLRLAGRLDHLQQACGKVRKEYDAKFKNISCEENSLREHLLYSERSPLLLCTIEKTGSTFWSRILSVSGSTTFTLNAFDIKITNAVYRMNKNFKHLSFDLGYKLLKNRKKVLFVRDPYSRLLSGYIDKFFNPNPSFWRKLGSKIVDSERESTNHASTCGHDVTFAEFVSYLIKWSKIDSCGVNPHFSESFRHCHPCDIDYDFIGKFETFKEDTHYILNTLNLTQVVNFQEFEERSDIDAIDDAVEYLYKQKRKSERCVDFHTSMMKVWRRLQMRGILKNLSKFPFQNRKTGNVSKAEFRAAVEKTYAKDKRSLRRHNNRLEVLHEAYSTLSGEQIRELRTVLKLDFELFGYDPYPDFLRSAGNYESSFKYMTL